MKVAVMTDSTAYIPVDMRNAYGIHMIPLSVNFEDETYQEEVDITTEEFYQKIKNVKELPTTSQPAIGLITEKLEELSEEFDAVVSIHLSSGISGTYQAVVSAGDMVEGIKVFAFDSEISCMAQGFYALEAAEMAKENKSPEEIMERLNEIKKTMHGYFVVDDLTNLHRGGRLNGAQAIIGSLLQVKPVLHFVDKVIVPFEKIRTRKKAINRVMGMLEEDAREGKIAKVVFVHANHEQDALDLRDEFLQKYPDTEALISYFGPVIGTHVGEGAIGVCWYYK
ncbi:DegV family protein [Ornithinibacillus bavariensis]|uniref:Protein DegV n=1 Tax=Ornithinibacillus bavariensis TaxID=545502 RepID=A0A920C6T6_9BACI|nr:DegV family protein [Ornithinibacillus bavariensis]GIO26439.1 protein DegV [Ornithinibacillus bavariensis]